MALTIPNAISNGIAADGANLGANFDAISAWATTVEADIAGTSPTGSVVMFAGSVLPSGYLRCRGDDVSRSTYADLFAAIGTSFGSGDGSTTFGLPDFRAAFPAGLDPSSSPFNSMGATGGSRDTTLPSHSHAVDDHVHSFSDTSSSDSHTHTVDINHDHGAFDSDNGGSHFHTGLTTKVQVINRNLSSLPSDGGWEVWEGQQSDTTASAATHDHSVNVPALGTTNKTTTSDSHTHTVSGTTSSNGPGVTQAIGSGDGTDTNIPPFVALDFIIKT